MPNRSSRSERVRRNVEMTHILTEWLQRAGLSDHPNRADLAVDLADILAAAEMVRESVEALLKLNPTMPDEADSALTIAAAIEAQLFGEIKGHLGSLEVAWPVLLERLDQLSPNNEEEHPD